MFRQFRHPSSSCLLECASSLCSRLFAQILMAFIGRWPVSGTVFIESFHVSSYTLCRLNQSDDFIFAAYLSSNAASNMFSITDPSSRVCCNFFSLSLCDCAACPSRWCEEWRGMIVGEAKIAANFACRISRNARLEDDAPAKVSILTIARIRKHWLWTVLKKKNGGG